MVRDSIATALQRASEPTMTVMELVGLAESLKASATLQAVADLYKTWIDHHQDDPLLYAILFNYGTVLTELRDLPAARAAFELSLEHNADFAPSRINLGRIYETMGAPGLSVKEWASTVDHLAVVSGVNITHKITALNQTARVLEAGGQDESSENLLRQSLEIDPSQREVVQHYLAARQRLCEWPLITPFERVSREVMMRGISPLSMGVFTDDPMLQLAVNAHYNVCDVGAPASPMVESYWAASARPKGAPLRIGYLSSDLREHAIGFLMAELFELHDRQEVEVFAYYCGVIPDDPTLRRIKETVDHWVPITDLDDAAAARRIADDGIQILVDVNGYTRDGRTKILPLRPTPVLVNWLGFPGSMGSPYHHYIIADDFIIPSGSEIYYSEKVLRLPCYQPNDRKRVIASEVPTRREAGLPEEAVVFCCFNGTQKISRPSFDRWLTILSRVPDSVLWLLSGSEAAQKKLCAYAQEKGVASDRLIFAPKKTNPQHLARYPLADLFLDTTPYGAHTTASDALWMGVPVLTLSGRSFASRVCGSLVRAAGLPELACTTPEAFVDRAVALGRDPDALLRYREQLAALRDRCDLFNTPKLVRHLEGLFKQMWQEFEQGALPQPDLQNLDTYLEIGAAQDHDATEVLAMKDYEGWWVENLWQRHRYRPIMNDARLWTSARQKEREEKS